MRIRVFLQGMRTYLAESFSYGTSLHETMTKDMFKKWLEIAVSALLISLLFALLGPGLLAAFFPAPSEQLLPLVEVFFFPWGWISLFASVILLVVYFGALSKEGVFRRNANSPMEDSSTASNTRLRKLLFPVHKALTILGWHQRRHQH